MGKQKVKGKKQNVSATAEVAEPLYSTVTRRVRSMEEEVSALSRKMEDLSARVSACHDQVVMSRQRMDELAKQFSLLEQDESCTRLALRELVEEARKTKSRSVKLWKIMALMALVSWAPYLAEWIKSMVK